MQRSPAPLAGLLLLVSASSCLQRGIADVAPPGTTERAGSSQLAAEFVQVGELLACEHTWDLAFTPDGRYLAAGHLSLFDVATRRKVIDYAVGDPDGVNRISISADGRRIAARGKVTGWHLFELATGRRLPVPPELEVDEGLTPRRPRIAGVLDRVDDDDVAVHRDGEFVAWASGAQITVFDITRRAVVSTFEHTDGHLLGLAFHPGGEILASTSAGKVGVQARDARLWDARSGQELRALPWSGGFVWATAFRPDGRLLAVGGEGGVTLWERREQ